jgi:hypothetical protein
MTLRSRFTVSALCTLTSLFAFTGTIHADATATIKIEQVSSGQIGTWTLLSTDGSSKSSSDTGVDKTNYSMSLSEFSPLTLIVTPPAGMSVKISMYRGGDLKTTTSTPQMTITPFPNDSYRFVIQYALTKLGSLGVTSNPSNLRVRIKGPTGKSYSSLTPHTFTNIPAGQYSVIVSPSRKCIQPATHSVVVDPGGRNVVDITLMCDVKATVEPSRTRPSKRSLVESVEQRESKPAGQRK